MCDAHLDLTTEAESWNGNVIARLGEGAQGEVLLGDNMDGRGHVAIKVGLRVGAIDREAAVLSAMTGVAGFPKVLHYKAAGPNDGGMLVMELLGPSVQDLWQRTLSRTHVVSPTLLRVARGALRRLRQLHLAGFVHNDVKPANLLLGASSGSLRQANEIHLIDFGLASRCGAACEPSHHNDAEPQQPIGTPSFASLAAHQRRRPMRPVDDIESLVYTLAYLAVGQLPWTEASCATAAAMKRQLLADGCDALLDTCPLADVMMSGGHCADVAYPLHALWAEVVRCHGHGHGHGRGASVDYDACFAALGGGGDLSGHDETTPAVELNNAQLHLDDVLCEARGTLLPGGLYRP